jgi:cobalt-zinc-cadmium efflux system outer membrane protein
MRYLFLACGLVGWVNGVQAQPITAVAADVLAAMRPSHATPSSPTPVSSDSVLTLDAVLRLVETHNLHLGALQWEVRAREALAEQSGLRPNPVLTAELENAGGSGAFSGLGGAERTLSLGQVLELGGDRRARRAVARSEYAVARRDYESLWWEVLAETYQRFGATLAAQHQLAVAEAQYTLATQVFEVVQARVAAGRSAPPEATRAYVTQQTARLNLQQQQHALQTARATLSLLWGQPEPHFARVTGEFERTFQVPEPDSLYALLARHPMLQRQAAVQAAREAAWQQERARRVPNVDFSAGYRYLGEFNTGAFVAGMTLPLPLFDRNRGPIQATLAQIEQAQSESEALQTALTSDLLLALERYHTATAEVEELEGRIQPAAEQAFLATRTGYTEGKFDYLALMEAQRTLFEVRIRTLEAQLALHETVVILWQLTGTFPTLAPDVPNP